MNGQTTPVKVFLWTLPRSLSTVLCRCIGAIEGVQIVFEAYRTAYHDGPDANKLGLPDSYILFRKRAREVELPFPKSFAEETCSFSWVKEMLESDIPGKSVIFAKDFAYCVHGRYDKIPHGFQHAFLIRHPHKALLSYKKMKINQMKMNPSTLYEEIPETVRPPHHGYKEMYELFKHIQNRYNYEPIIIDADDLQRNPAAILHKFCHSLGIPFTEKYLQWQEGEDFMNDWIMSEVTLKGDHLKEGGFFKGVQTSSAFLKPLPLPSKGLVPDDLHRAIDASMPYYEQLFSLRLMPDDEAA